MLHVSEHSYASDYRQPRHAHAETSITLVLGGSLRETVGRGEEIARPLSIVVKPGGTEHANEFGPHGARTLQIVLDPAEAAWAAGWERALREWRWLHAGPEVRPFLALLRARRAAAADAECVERGVYDVLAALPRGGDTAPGAEPPRWLRLVREEMDDAGSPRVRDLAASAGVHPVYLARQFRRHFGCSVGEHLRRRRIQSAAALIADTGTPLSTVSYSAGFADQAHMCRAFRDGTGVTPGDYRALAG